MLSDSFQSHWRNRKVATAITQNWPEVQTIDLSSTSTDFASFFIESDSLVLVAMPSFGGVAPQLALDRFAQINGNRAKCVLVAVYGNRVYESTLVQMEDTANAAGFQVIAAISAVAEHSIIREYAAGRPNAEDCKQLSAFGTKILKSTIRLPGSSRHSWQASLQKIQQRICSLY